MTKVLYVERRPSAFVSIEKAFREIAAGLPPEFTYEFQQVPYSSRVYDSTRNLLLFKPRPADIYHITGHINYMALALPPEQTVLSIMDVRFVNMNTGIRRLILKWLFLDLPVRRMKYVTAISEAVREEIIELTGCPPNKVRTLGLPLLSHLSNGPVKAFNTDRPLILQIGTMENKNIPNLARALQGLQCRLHIVGKLSDEQCGVLRDNAIDFECEEGLTDEEIRQRYEACDIVAYCSTYEGFGLPIIEAQAMRKPVLTSNISPMKETAGGGAALADPLSVRSIRDGLSRLIEDEDYRNSIVSLGAENVKRFSAASVAEDYAKLYREIETAVPGH